MKKVIGSNRTLSVPLFPQALLSAVLALTSASAPLTTLAAPTPPELPRAYVDTTLPSTSSQCTTTVPSGGNLQAAIDQAALGDTICLAAGATFTGNFNLRTKTTGSGWITIRTSTPDAQFVAAGVRATPRDRTKMARIVTPNGLPAIGVQPTDPSPHHYRLVGLEIATTHNYVFALVGLDNGWRSAFNKASTPADVPADITIDRCYIHGEPNYTLRRAVLMNGVRLAVIDSYLADAHEVGQDSQGILSYNGPGPYKIVNNYIEAATENILFGGAMADGPTMDPADIEVRRNHLKKHWHWRVEDPNYGGIPWSVKNLYEMKNGKRAIIDSNVMENNWAHAQNGAAIVLQGLPNEDGVWVVVSDVTFTNNIIRNSAWGVAMCGSCIYSPLQRTDPTAPNYSDPTISRVERVVFRNNLFENLSWPRFGWGSPTNLYGQVFQVGAPVDDLLIDHNTMLNSGNQISIFAGSAGFARTSSNFVATNNIVFQGIAGDSWPGQKALDVYMPGWVFSNNALIGVAASNTFPHPTGNFYPASVAQVGFANYNNGVGGDYRLLPSSPYKGLGANGKDLGADISTILNATSGVVGPLDAVPPGAPLNFR